jgi:hypothetical protein
MTRLIPALCLFALLSACGVDGPPQPPQSLPTQSGTNITVTGEARMGVVTDG